MKKQFKLYEIYKNEFFPRIKDIEKVLLLESIRGIETFDKVKTLEGEVIDMKALDHEITMVLNIMGATEPLLAPYLAELMIIYTWSVPTMATDGARIFINPKFGNDLSEQGKFFVLMHEVYHVLMMHMDRGKKYGRENAKRVNYAADYEINVLIIDDMPQHFSAALVHELQGLLEEDFRGKSMEEIYEIIKNDPKYMPQEQPKPPKSKPQPPKKGPLQVGDKVRVKSAGKKGIVKAVNPDGTFEIDILNEGLVFERLFNLILETYDRDDLVKIETKPEEGEGEGEGEEEQEEVEYEDDPNAPKKPKDPWTEKPKNPEGEGQGEGQGQGEGDEKGEGEGQGKGERTSGDETQEEREYAEGLESGYDDTVTGGIIPEKEANDIAQREGYGETNAGSETERAAKAEKILKELSKSLSNSSGEGGGKNAGGGFSNLRKALSKIIMGEVDWTDELKNLIGKILSKKKFEQRLGNKKYLHQGDFRQDRYKKNDVIRNVFVAVDMSGSMYSIPMFVSRIVGEINKIVFTNRIREVIVGYFTSIMHMDTIDTITSASEEEPYIPESIPGTGGTDFRSVFQWIEEDYNNTANLLIIFTDGGDQIPEPPEFADNIVWVIYDMPSFDAGYGHVIHIAK